MDNLITLSQLNDFIFCPISIYFHNLYADLKNILYQERAQIAGTQAHKAVDHNTYSKSKDVLTGIMVYSDELGIMGKIDTFHIKEGILTERKKKIKTIYDGYVFQLYGEYYCMKEMGYTVNKLRFYSMDDNKVYPVLLPSEDKKMDRKFKQTIQEMRVFDFHLYEQGNSEKCSRCIYHELCDRSLYA